MPTRRWRCIALATFLLSACGHVPILTIWRMRNFDASKVDPNVVRAAVQVPDNLEPRPHGLKLVFRYWPDGEEARKRAAEVTLQQVASMAEAAAFASKVEPGRHVRVFRIEPDDVARLTALQDEMAADRRNGKGRPRGSLSVNFEVCRTGSLSDQPLLVTTYLRTEAQGPFLTLIEDVDLREYAVSEGKTLEDEAPPCRDLRGPP
jgi:hypothetical protein